jgi:hypothetical protein
MLERMGQLTSSETSRERLRENLHNVSAPMPEGHFKIERKVYQSFLEQSQYGDMSYLRLADENNNSNVIFFGAKYDSNFPIKNLYKALNLIKPDALLV